MVAYKENPNIEKLQVVTTFNGEKEYRKNCKFINEKYYVIDRDCFYIEDRWRRIDSGSLVFDWEKKEYTLKQRAMYTLNYGLVKNDKGELELGYFSPNPYNNIPTNSEKFGNLTAISSDILGNEWFEDMRQHIWYKSSEHTSESVRKKKIIQNYENPAARGYNIEDNPNDFNAKTFNYSKYKPFIAPKVKSLSKYIGDISFGCEFELFRGYLPIHLQNRYGVVPCRDGSLNGGIELVTIPMSGAKGLQTIINLADDLKIRGEINLDCSFHIHFGNIGTDKLSVISLYKLCRSIQEELFTMFPYYKSAPDGIKQKNYTKKLQKLNIGALKDISKEAYDAYLLDSWNKLFNFYAEKQVTLETYNKKTREHPIANKWSRNSR